MSKQFFGNYDTNIQSGAIWLTLGDGTFQLEEEIQPFAGSSFVRNWNGHWVETDVAVVLTIRETDHGNSSTLPPGSIVTLTRRGPELVWEDLENTALRPTAPPAG